MLRMFCAVAFALSTLGVVYANVAPIFIDDMSGYSLPENTPVGSIVYNLTAFDADGDPLYFGFSGDDYFTVSRNTGIVRLRRVLDYDKDRKQLRVTMIVSDLTNDARSPITIKVLDNNDEQPVFSEDTYKVDLPEDTALGVTVIADLLVTDRDIVNRFMLVQCSPALTDPQYFDACDKFVLNNNVSQSSNRRWLGSLLLNEALNYEEKQFYQIPLQALDGNPQNDMVKTVEVTVIDVQDEPPYFIKADSVSIDEGVPSDTLVTEVIARDGDKSNVRPIWYSIIPANRYFQIGSRDGIIRVLSDIDRESADFILGFVFLTIKAQEIINVATSELGNDILTTATASIRVTIDDVNDNAPTFNPQNYNTTIKEDIPSNSAIPGLSMTITDPDQRYFNQQLASMYSLELRNHQDVFEVFPPTGRGTSTASIKVKDTNLIDYETGPRIYYLTVIAKETNTRHRLEGTASVTVHVENVNDNPPQFSQDLYTAQVSETAQGGDPVITITTSDPDTVGVSDVRYNLIGNGANLFVIGAQTGIVTVKACSHPGVWNCIDYEHNREYVLSVTAADDNGRGITVTQPLTVKILDENDNVPRFTMDEYVGNIEERSTALIPPGVTVQANDDDDSSVVRYSVAGDTALVSGLFTVHPVTGVISPTREVLYTHTPKVGGVESGRILLSVEATDGINTVSTRVIINVFDLNDGPPRFDLNGSYEFSIAESTLGDVTVGTVSADDPDSATSNAGIFRYAIQSGSKDKFTIDAEHGIITTTAGATFDYDVINQYDLQVNARDRGSPPLQSDVIVVIHIIDQNNQNPFFTPSLFRGEVREDVAIGTLVEQLRASDNDLHSDLRFSLGDVTDARSPSGQLVRFSTVQDWFTVDDITGEVTVNRNLSYTILSQITYSIKVEDKNSTSEQIGTGRLLITILDFNTYPPVWTSGINNLTMNENQPLGTVVRRVLAYDPDSQGISEYRMRRHEYFEIDPLSGEVKIQRLIDYERGGGIFDRTSFVVEAVDSHPFNPLTSTATVYVDIINVNDNTPEFLQSDYQVSRTENLAPGLSVLTVNATDLDAGECGEFTFGIIAPLSATDPQNEFNIDNITGVVTVSAAGHLDLESEVSKTFQVTVTDKACGPLNRINRNAVQVTVILLSENDNAPKFDPDLYEITISTLFPAGRVIQRLSATDADISHTTRNFEDTLTFHKIVGSGDPTDLFDVSAGSGAIRIARNLNGHVGTHSFDVRVTDGLHADTARVIINVREYNNTDPVWVIPASSNSRIEVLEEQYLGMYVIQVSAVDNDAGLNGKLEYSFIDSSKRNEARFISSTGDFQINPITGVISAEQVFDRETKDSYILELAARDYGATRGVATTYLDVQIKDVNDHEPVFEKRRLSCIIPEDFVPAPITSCGATAVDLDVNDTVSYRLVGENTNTFSVDDVTGQISLAKSVGLEEIRVYEFEMEAYNEVRDDHVITSRRKRAGPLSIISVRVEVTDVNDNPPVFTENNHKACVSMNAPLNQGIMRFLATDLDADSAITYTISQYQQGTGDITSSVNIPFEVVGSSLRTRTLLGRYGGETFTLYIQASDGRHTASSTVQIVVSNPEKQVALVVMQEVSQVKQIKQVYERILKEQLEADSPGSYIVCLFDVRTHVNSDGSTNMAWSDLYFNVFYISGDGAGGAGGGGTGVGVYTLYDSDRLNALLIKIWSTTRLHDVLTGYFVREIKVEETADDLWSLPVLVILILIAILVILLLIVLCCCFWCNSGRKSRRMKEYANGGHSRGMLAYPDVDDKQVSELGEERIYDNHQHLVSSYGNGGFQEEHLDAEDFHAAHAYDNRALMTSFEESGHETRTAAEEMHEMDVEQRIDAHDVYATVQRPDETEVITRTMTFEEHHSSYNYQDQDLREHGSRSSSPSTRSDHADAGHFSTGQTMEVEIRESLPPLTSHGEIDVQIIDSAGQAHVIHESDHHRRDSTSTNSSVSEIQVARL